MSNRTEGCGANEIVRGLDMPPGLLIVKMDVDTTARRFISAWGEATWRLELAELCAVLNGAPMSSERWRRFNRDARRAAISRVFTLGVVGEKLSAAWREEIEALEREYSGGT